jgi:protease-4
MTSHGDAMKRALIVIGLLLTLFHAEVGRSQTAFDHYSRNSFLQAPAGAFQDGLAGFANPANLALLHAPEMQFHWSTDGSEATSINDWGFFAGARGFGFGGLRQHANGLRITDYRLSTGFGTQSIAFGLAYGWSTRDKKAFGGESLVSTGAIIRPNRFVSLGLVGNFSLESNAREGVAEIGVRPLGTSRLTVFADGAMQKQTRLKDAEWSAGAALQVVPGVHFVARYFKHDDFTTGLRIDFGGAGAGAQAHFDSQQKHSYNSYMIRSGGVLPSVFQTHFGKGRSYVALDLKGLIDYQKFQLFDDQTHRFFDVLSDIRAAAKDSRVAAIALNLSSMRVRPEHAWEIREELKKARAAGKKIIIFIDNDGMTAYHLASVADKIIMDPEGILQLQGYVMGRSYMKGTLQRLGLGFDEWRFFKYKSALESLSRDSFSDADREQYQAYIDDRYELVRTEVCEGRRLTQEKFDQVVDEGLLFVPQDALAAGLVDTLARWSALGEVMKKLNGSKVRGLAARSLAANALAQEQWGELPGVAVVYGLGVCAMDEGIKARWLERVFLGLAKNPSVKAVVFRVDSPGGDGMASDLVAEALKKCAESKPVIVSQGQVAGSGGYWISMYGDTIVAGPNTITGSIGVIGGWLYDKGLTEKLGMTSDHVKRGAHAEVGFGVSLPFIGAQIPARNLNGEERTKIEEFFMKFYGHFVEKVAKGRNRPVDEIRSIAEGHFYSGSDGKANGLVDEIGGLFTALAIAQQKAGLKPEQEIKIVEIPKYKGLFDFHPKLFPFTTRLEEDPVLEYIRMLSARPGQPLPMMVPGTYPEVE